MQPVALIWDCHSIGNLKVGVDPRFRYKSLVVGISPKFVKWAIITGKYEPVHHAKTIAKLSIQVE